MPYEARLRGRWSAPGNVYLITTSTLGRNPVFARFDAALVAARELAAIQRSGMVSLLAWVVMPDRVHVLLQLEREDLSTTIGSLKGRTSRAIHRLRGDRGPLWQHGYHERAVRREDDLREMARYLCANPLRAGLVTSLRDYPFWDACWLDEKRPAEAGPTTASREMQIPSG